MDGLSLARLVVAIVEQPGLYQMTLIFIFRFLCFFHFPSVKTTQLNWTMNGDFTRNRICSLVGNFIRAKSNGPGNLPVDHKRKILTSNSNRMVLLQYKSQSRFVH
jgi:hypothetical protein